MRKEADIKLIKKMEKQSKKENKLYLEEDQDLIDRINVIGPMSTGQVADQQKYKISTIQIEAILRSRKSMNAFDKSTSYFSKVLGVFALIQIIIAITQFSFTVSTSTNKWLGFFYIISLAVMLLYIIRTASKGLEKG